MANPNIGFEEALENYYDENPEVFMANFEYDQDNISHPIDNMAEYLNCFNDGKEVLTYDFVLYVDQPIKGENTVVTANPPNVGHTFFSLVKNNTDGTKIIKTLGFYPNGNDYLEDLTDLEGPGIFEDNGTQGNEHDYDVSVSFNNISQEQFNNIIQDLISIENANYDLNDYNCTSVAHWLAQDNLGFTVEPTTSMYRWFIVGSIYCWGVNPGQYGQDLNEQPLEAAPNIMITSGNNPNNLKARTSTSNCN